MRERHKFIQCIRSAEIIIFTYTPLCLCGSALKFSFEILINEYVLDITCIKFQKIKNSAFNLIDR